MDELRQSIESTGEFQTVENLGAAWGKALRKTETENPTASVVGSGRGGAPSAAPADLGPLRGRDLVPFVRALGNFSCRLAKVHGMTQKEAEAISEPGAAVLNKWAPQVAEWVPELTLATALSDFVESRAEEYRANRNTDEPQPSSDEGATVVPPEGF